jgi:hypothetical protein
MLGIETLLATTILPALLPAAADGIRGIIAKFTGGAGANPQTVEEYIKLQDANNKRLELLANLEGQGETYKWVEAIRKLQRPVVVFTTLATWVVVFLNPQTYDDFTRDVVQASASSVWFYLFGERGYMAIKAVKKG